MTDTNEFRFQMTDLETDAKAASEIVEMIRLVALVHTLEDETEFDIEVPLTVAIRLANELAVRLRERLCKERGEAFERAVQRAAAA
ncbi:hypothetical protein [Thiocapsa roseopersicina]|uniref:Uncharacterized protein n=1 Tax=Thiocapsa roseopersicina TaxID=1058 RepID=A0A1H2Y1W1_THIRO|nr:hypothetical protein [Thiocapsa roseopersicina]SDW99126.1 hypothetical protein SAMN05421783_1122 [Thiocapsa roseopersicina]